jgi:circadian clock protein KaiB
MCELTLYVAGDSASSKKAIKDLRALLEARCKGRHSLKIIDVTKNPQLAAGNDVFVTPTVVKAFPPPIRRIVGDLSIKERVLAALGLT